MKKQYFIPACVLVAAAIGFLICTAAHPELSFPWSIRITHILYGLYADAVVLLFVLSFCKTFTVRNVMTILLELGAVFFLVQSILSVFPTGKPSWHLTLALGLNCIALFLSTTRKKRES